jgi:glycosyltransferase involved in cell wall biosynthesis
MLSSGMRVPSSRFRMIPYARHFRVAGHQCHVAHSFPEKYDYIPWFGFRPSQKLKRIGRYIDWCRSKWRGDDVVVIDREVFDDSTTTFEERFRATTSKLVLDLDDAVFLRYPEKFERLASLADLIICGNAFIQEWAAARNAHTLILPTCVEMAQYREKVWSQAPSRRVRIGWMGTSGNIRYLQVAAPALRRLATTHALELLVIAPDAGPLTEVDLTGVTVRHATWDGPREVDQLHEIDIGLMPLFADNEWDKYKCGLKLIQYMAVGIPAVASPVGVNASIVTHGRDGFVAASDSEWEAALRPLLIDENLRRTIGAAARETARTRFSIEANFPIYEAALRELCAVN